MVWFGERHLHKTRVSSLRRYTHLTTLVDGSACLAYSSTFLFYISFNTVAFSHIPSRSYTTSMRALVGDHFTVDCASRTTDTLASLCLSGYFLSPNLRRNFWILLRLGF
jgi:hypothetical protein